LPDLRRGLTIVGTSRERPAVTPGAGRDRTVGDRGEDVEFVDDVARSRYEVRQNGEVVGFITYRRNPRQVVMLHAETDPAVEGRGLASRLAAYALDDVRSRSLSVVPLCPFVRRYIESHPAYGDLVAPGETNPS